jgi:hypothetical protein
MRFEREWLVGLTRFLPPWLSNFALAWIFWLLWNHPERFGWELAGDFQALLYIEIGIVFAALFLLSGWGAPLAELSGLLIAAALGVGISSLVDPVVGSLVAVHFVARASVTWRNEQAVRRQARSFGFSLAALGFAWFVAAMFSTEQGAWAADVVPRDLWWDLPALHGSRTVPHGLPIFGFFYFSTMTVVEGIPAVFRWLGVVLGLQGSETTPA